MTNTPNPAPKQKYPARQASFNEYLPVAQYLRRCGRFRIAQEMGIKKAKERQAKGSGNAVYTPAEF